MSENGRRIQTLFCHSEAPELAFEDCSGTNLNILKYPECPCWLQNGDFEDKSKNMQEISCMPAAEPRGL